MVERNDHIEDLIGKVLAGEATAAEKGEVDAFCKASPDNQRYFDQLASIFSRASSSRIKVNFDTDAAWVKVRTKLSGKTDLPKKENDVWLWGFAKIAAGLALLLASSVFVYQWLNEPVAPVQIAAGTKRVQDTLPDGSTAFLNKKSTLSYVYDSKSSTRKVKLTGEGFFDVKHQEEKPFVIEAEEALIRDIGTTFNVKAYPGSDTVEVVVTSGVVQFYTLSDPGIQINAGETGLYSRKGKSFLRLHRADTNVLAYKTGIFSFHATDLKSVVEQINEVYDSKISLGSDKLADCRLTVSFKNDDLDTIVEVIAETLSLKVVRSDGKQIVLTGPGCQ